VAELVDRCADPVQAEAATVKAADALWRFLDGFPVSKDACTAAA
jgi:pyrroloquinoline quinone (PQQ) biosynthesis protein C